jgi:hypothetical protein
MMVLAVFNVVPLVRTPVSCAHHARCLPCHESGDASQAAQRGTHGHLGADAPARAALPDFDKPGITQAEAATLMAAGAMGSGGSVRKGGPAARAQAQVARNERAAQEEAQGSGDGGGGTASEGGDRE